MESLTASQQIAVESLAAGATHARAAEAAGVARETVSRWVGHHPGVRAALRTIRSTMAVEQADLVRSIRGKALRLAELLLDLGDIDPLSVLRTVPSEVDTPEVYLTNPSVLVDQLISEREFQLRVSSAGSDADPFEALDAVLNSSDNSAIEAQARSDVILGLAGLLGILSPTSPL